VQYVVEAAQLAQRHMRDAPRTGCALKIAPMHVARTSSNRVNTAYDLYWWLLSHRETLCAYSSGSPITTEVWSSHKEDNQMDFAYISTDLLF